MIKQNKMINSSSYCTRIAYSWVLMAFVLLFSDQISAQVNGKFHFSESRTIDDFVTNSKTAHVKFFKPNHTQGWLSYRVDSLKAVEGNSPNTSIQLVIIPRKYKTEKLVEDQYGNYFKLIGQPYGDNQYQVVELSSATEKFRALTIKVSAKPGEYFLDTIPFFALDSAKLYDYTTNKMDSVSAFAYAPVLFSTEKRPIINTVNYAEPMIPDTWGTVLTVDAEGGVVPDRNSSGKLFYSYDVRGKGDNAWLKNIKIKTLLPEVSANITSKNSLLSPKGLPSYFAFKQDAQEVSITMQMLFRYAGAEASEVLRYFSFYIAKNGQTGANRTKIPFNQFGNQVYTVFVPGSGRTFQTIVKAQLFLDNVKKDDYYTISVEQDPEIKNLKFFELRAASADKYNLGPEIKELIKKGDPNPADSKTPYALNYFSGVHIDYLKQERGIVFPETNIVHLKNATPDLTKNYLKESLGNAYNPIQDISLSSTFDLKQITKESFVSDFVTILPKSDRKAHFLIDDNHEFVGFAKRYKLNPKSKFDTATVRGLRPQLVFINKDKLVSSGSKELDPSNYNFTRDLLVTANPYFDNIYAIKNSGNTEVIGFYHEFTYSPTTSKINTEYILKSREYGVIPSANTDWFGGIQANFKEAFKEEKTSFVVYARISSEPGYKFKATKSLNTKEGNIHPTNSSEKEYSDLYHQMYSAIIGEIDNKPLAVGDTVVFSSVVKGMPQIKEDNGVFIGFKGVDDFLNELQFVRKKADNDFENISATGDFKAMLMKELSGAGSPSNFGVPVAVDEVTRGSVAESDMQTVYKYSATNKAMSTDLKTNSSKGESLPVGAEGTVDPSRQELAYQKFYDTASTYYLSIGVLDPNSASINSGVAKLSKNFTNDTMLSPLFGIKVYDSLRSKTEFSLSKEIEYNKEIIIKSDKDDWLTINPKTTPSTVFRSAGTKGGYMVILADIKTDGIVKPDAYKFDIKEVNKSRKTEKVGTFTAWSKFPLTINYPGERETVVQAVGFIRNYSSKFNEFSDTIKDIPLKQLFEAGLLESAGLSTLTSLDITADELKHLKAVVTYTPNGTDEITFSGSSKPKVYTIPALLDVYQYKLEEAPKVEAIDVSHLQFDVKQFLDTISPESLQYDEYFTHTAGDEWPSVMNRFVVNKDKVFASDSGFYLYISNKKADVMEYNGVKTVLYDGSYFPKLERLEYTHKTNSSDKFIAFRMSVTDDVLKLDGTKEPLPLIKQLRPSESPQYSWLASYGKIFSAQFWESPASNEVDVHISFMPIDTLDFKIVRTARGVELPEPINPYKSKVNSVVIKGIKDKFKTTQSLYKGKIFFNEKVNKDNFVKLSLSAFSDQSKVKIDTNTVRGYKDALTVRHKDNVTGNIVPTYLRSVKPISLVLDSSKYEFNFSKVQNNAVDEYNTYLRYTFSATPTVPSNPSDYDLMMNNLQLTSDYNVVYAESDTYKAKIYKSKSNSNEFIFRPLHDNRTTSFVNPVYPSKPSSSVGNTSVGLDFHQVQYFLNEGYLENGSKLLIEMLMDGYRGLTDDVNRRYSLRLKKNIDGSDLGNNILVTPTLYNGVLNSSKFYLDIENAAASRLDKEEYMKFDIPATPTVDDFRKWIPVNFNSNDKLAFGSQAADSTVYVMISGTKMDKWGTLNLDLLTSYKEFDSLYSTTYTIDGVDHKVILSQRKFVQGRQWIHKTLPTSLLKAQSMFNVDTFYLTLFNPSMNVVIKSKKTIDPAQSNLGSNLTTALTVPNPAHMFLNQKKPGTWKVPFKSSKALLDAFNIEDFTGLAEDIIKDKNDTILFGRATFKGLKINKIDPSKEARVIFSINHPNSDASKIDERDAIHKLSNYVSFNKKDESSNFFTGKNDQYAFITSVFQDRSPLKLDSLYFFPYTRDGQAIFSRFAAQSAVTPNMITDTMQLKVYIHAMENITIFGDEKSTVGNYTIGDFGGFWSSFYAETTNRGKDFSFRNGLSFDNSNSGQWAKELGLTFGNYPEKGRAFLSMSPDADSFLNKSDNTKAFDESKFFSFNNDDTLNIYFSSYTPEKVSASNHKTAYGINPSILTTALYNKLFASTDPVSEIKGLLPTVEVATTKIDTVGINEKIVSSDGARSQYVMFGKYHILKIGVPISVIKDKMKAKGSNNASDVLNNKHFINLLDSKSGKMLGMLEDLISAYGDNNTKQQKVSVTVDFQKFQHIYISGTSAAGTKKYHPYTFKLDRNKSFSTSSDAGPSYGASPRQLTEFVSNGAYLKFNSINNDISDESRLGERTSLTNVWKNLNNTIDASNKNVTYLKHTDEDYKNIFVPASGAGKAKSELIKDTTIFIVWSDKQLGREIYAGWDEIKTYNKVKGSDYFLAKLRGTIDTILVRRLQLDFSTVGKFNIGTLMTKLDHPIFSQTKEFVKDKAYGYLTYGDSAHVNTYGKNFKNVDYATFNSSTGSYDSKIFTPHALTRYYLDNPLVLELEDGVASQADFLTMDPANIITEPTDSDGYEYKLFKSSYEGMKSTSTSGIFYRAGLDHTWLMMTSYKYDKILNSVSIIPIDTLDRSPQDTVMVVKFQNTFNKDEFTGLLVKLFAPKTAGSPELYLMNQNHSRYIIKGDFAKDKGEKMNVYIYDIDNAILRQPASRISDETKIKINKPFFVERFY